MRYKGKHFAPKSRTSERYNITLKTQSNIKNGQWKKSALALKPVPKKYNLPFSLWDQNESQSTKSSPSLSLFKPRHLNLTNSRILNLLRSALAPRSPIWVICSFSWQLPLSSLAEEVTLWILPSQINLFTEIFMNNFFHWNGSGNP